MATVENELKDLEVKVQVMELKARLAEANLRVVEATSQRKKILGEFKPKTTTKAKTTRKTTK